MNISRSTLLLYLQNSAGLRQKPCPKIIVDSVLYTRHLCYLLALWPSFRELRRMYCISVWWACAQLQLTTLNTWPVGQRVQLISPAFPTVLGLPFMKPQEQSALDFVIGKRNFFTCFERSSVYISPPPGQRLNPGQKVTVIQLYRSNDQPPPTAKIK